jgi:uncharacterized membrane protein
MQIELILMIFDQDEVTPNAWLVFDRMRKTRAFRLENAGLVERDAAGKAFIHQFKRYPTWKPPLDDTFLILFTNAIFSGSAGERERDPLIAELDEVFLKEVADAWHSSNSALLIFSPRQSLVDTRRLLNYLAEFNGTLIQTTFPEQIIESILEQSKSSELSKNKK